jgi:hypothetical protein
MNKNLLLSVVLASLSLACYREPLASELSMQTEGRKKNQGGGADAQLSAVCCGVADPAFLPGAPPEIRSVSRWFLKDSDPPIPIRPDFLGLHVDRTTGWPDFKPVPLPSFAYGLARSHDHERTTMGADLQWARIEPNPGDFRWGALDGWIEDTEGKARIFTVVGTPLAYQRYPGETWRYPYLPGGASPPSDPGVLVQFVSAILARYPHRIPYIELYNEPNFYAGEDTDRTRWDPAATAATGAPPFFSGTPEDLARLARALRAALPADVKLLVGAWEGQTAASPSNSMTRLSHAPDGAGGYGKDHVQAFSFHHYFYRNDPNGLIDTIDGYRARLAEDKYSPDIEFHCTEIGHESPTPASDISDEDVARNILRATYIAAAMRVDTIAWYKFGSEHTLKNPAEHPIVADALARAGTLSRRVIRQAALLDDGTVWLRFADNTEAVQ